MVIFFAALFHLLCANAAWHDDARIEHSIGAAGNSSGRPSF